jgi:hypothetical protein
MGSEFKPGLIGSYDPRACIQADIRKLLVPLQSILHLEFVANGITEAFVIWYELEQDLSGE